MNIFNEFNEKICIKKLINISFLFFKIFINLWLHSLENKIYQSWHENETWK